jgi:RND superfamily putative drug exporter
MAGEELRVTEGAAPGKQLRLGSELVLGRSSTEDGRLGDDPEMSRRHARITRDAGGQITIEDLGSANGTWVNGERIAGRQPLHPGDTVKVGQTVLVLTDETGSVPAPTRLGVPEVATRLASAPSGEELHVTEGNARGQRMLLEKEFVIGRSEGEEGRLGDDREISRRHARIKRDGGGHLTIEDLGSANGTWVNGERIREPQRLAPGDTIRVGQTTLEVRGAARPAVIEQAPETVPPSSAPAQAGGEQLRVTEGNAVGKRFELGDEFVIGRLAGEDSTFGADGKMSRRHALITRGPRGELAIEDVGSANGTWVNGERIRRPRSLQPGDVIRVGVTSLEVVHPSQATVTSVGALPAVAGITYRARWPILALVMVIVAVGAVYGLDVATRLTSENDFSDRQAESVTAEERLAKAAGAEPTPGVVALVRAGEGSIASPQLDARVRRAAERAERLEAEAREAQQRAERSGAPEDVARAQELQADAQAAAGAAQRADQRAQSARSESARQQVERVTQIMRDDPAAARVVNYYETPDPGLVSKDRRSTFIPLFLKPDSDEEVVAERLIEELRPERGVRVGGAGAADLAVEEQAEQDLASAEAIAMPLLFLLSLFVFRGLVAALLPVFVGIVTVLGTFLALRIVNEFLPLSVFSLNMVIGLGLGLAIDYSLFILSRYREELDRMGPGPEPLRRTLQTAGRTVLFSAATVAVSLLSLLIFPQRFLYSMGIGGALCTVVAATTALGALAALIAVLGPKVNALAPRRWRVAMERTARQEQSGMWYRLSRGVMRRPLPIATVSAALLIAVGTPFLGVKFTGIDATVLPKDSAPRQVSDVLERDFADSSSAPISLAVTAPQEAGPKLSGYVEDLKKLSNVDSVAAPRRLDGRTWQIDVAPAHRALDERSLQLVRDIRALKAPYPVAASGESAKFVDQQDSLRDRLPAGLAILSAATMVVLFLMTGSVVLPIKSVLMNFLGLTATLGLLVLIFQDGHLEGILDYTSQGALNSTQPILLFVVAFGLSTDYGVFLLTRIKEVRDTGASNDEAVAVGLERTGRIVTAAALLFSVAMGAFAASEIVFVKLLGVGTVLAVLIDATIIRALLVPSLMTLLGERNWWAPRPLQRIHDRFGISEGEPSGSRATN